MSMNGTVWYDVLYLFYNSTRCSVLLKPREDMQYLGTLLFGLSIRSTKFVGSKGGTVCLRTSRKLRMGLLSSLPSSLLSKSRNLFAPSVIVRA